MENYKTGVTVTNYLRNLMEAEGRQQLGRVFRYLEALNERRNPPQRNVEAYSFHLYLNAIPQSANCLVKGDDFVLKVLRPSLSPCPAPPSIIRSWLIEGWDKPVHEPRVLASIGDEEDDSLERFEDSPDRVDEWNQWLVKWRRWAPVRQIENTVEKLYQDLYEQYSLLERDGERFELLLGDGIVKWRLPEGAVNHPILLQPVELMFDAPKAEFTVIESARPVEFYTGPLRSADVTPQTVAKARQQVQENPEIHPLEDVITVPFLKGFAASLDEGGEFVEVPSLHITEHLRIFRNPVLFRRGKNAGLAQAVRQVLDDLDEGTEEGRSPNWGDGPPEGLMRFVGIETRPNGNTAANNGPRDSFDDEEGIYFTKPANHEQHQIIRKLRSAGCVLVQGPPGTGKTHTIANLIGHLLAEGKSVLVTSHTTKALSVVTDKVVKPLQPLCVSVLESDRENRDRVESAVQSMAERLSSGHDVYATRAKELQERRSQLIARTRELRNQLRFARRSEYDPISFQGEMIAPLEAALEIARYRDTNGWIPGSIHSGDSLPLQDQDIQALYQTNTSVTPDDEANYPDVGPDLGLVVDPDEFEAIVRKATTLRQQDIKVAPALLTHSPTKEEVLVTAATTLVNDTLRFFAADTDSWKRQIVDRARRGEGDGWLRLIKEVEDLVEKVLSVEDSLLRIAPHWSETVDKLDTIARCLEIEEYLRSGKKLSPMTFLLKPAWKKVADSLTTAYGAPNALEHFAAGRAAIEIDRKREELRRVWNGKMSEINGPILAHDIERPERKASPYLVDIKSCVDWHLHVWPNVEVAIQKTGLSIRDALLSVPVTNMPAAEVERLIHCLREIILPALQSIHNGIQLSQIEEQLTRCKEVMRLLSTQFPGVPLTQQLWQAGLEEETSAYRYAHALLRQVYGKAEIILLRRELIRRLALVAPDWAKAIRIREGVHGSSKLPGDLGGAWRWKFFDQELTARARMSIQDILASLTATRNEFEKVTVDLVEALAWNGLVQQTSMEMRMALTGYVQILKRMGKGTGKRVPRLILEAQKYMAASQKAVPVWVMPLTRIIESFNVGKAKFDVVIIDEASQMDLNGLLAMYMAKQVIIVGDDKQVEPLDVGTKIEEVQSLIDEHLDGIPRCQLWDGTQSVYSLAEGPFEPIRLREHFRCVPDIIRYSNNLSYDGTILPLREDADVITRPFVVPFYIEKATLEGKVNRREAEALVAILKSCSEQSEYAGKTFGVIHLVGEEGSPQSKYVEQLARQHLGDVELQNRKFRCGNSAQFQGDERDIMFLSVVDVPANGPLRLRAEDLYKKRFNVAASRARDQMWVLYSLNPNTDLQANDLRRDLITYALDPKARERLYEEKVGATESDFEQRVLKRLVDAGFYMVEPQYRVGAYRLDFAIRQDALRIAIECDGERFHGADKLDEDLARQATLERLGWRFIRIRGSEFYRNEVAAMERVIRALDDLGIDKSQQATPASLEEPNDLLQRVKSQVSSILFAWQHPELVQNAPPVPNEVQDTSEQVVVSQPSLDLADGDFQPPSDYSQAVVSSLPLTPPSLEGGAVSGTSWLASYEEFQRTGLPDPKSATLTEMSGIIVDIVRIEGPATIRTVIERYRVGAGYGRLKGPTRDAVNSAIEQVLLKGTIVRLEQDHDDSLGDVVSLPFGPKVRLRMRGPRDLEDIPMNEIAALARRLNLRLRDEETALRYVLACYGLKRLTKGASNRLQTALAQARQEAMEVDQDIGS